MKKDCLTTFSKVDFNTFEPEEDKIRIEDIAHALSMMTRANGHFPQFFSVGQHCIQCCHEATARNYLPQTALACLLHDGSEAYLGGHYPSGQEKHDDVSADRRTAAAYDLHQISGICAGGGRGRTDYKH